MRILAAVAALALAGCTASNAEAGGTDTWWKREAVKAACMAERGFKYEAWVPDFTQTADDLRRADGHYPSMRKHREKYGHTVFSGYVYRTTKEAGGVDLQLDTPNDKYIAALSLSQGAAYSKADETCFVRAVKTVLGKDVTGIDGLHKGFQIAHEAVDARDDSDPELVALAHDYAVCLRAKGYRVSSEKPSEISDLGRSRFHDRLSELGRQQQPDAEPGTHYLPNLTPEDALPHLREEITSALDDLECGKEFLRVYSPPHNAADQRLGAEWGIR